MLRLAGPIFAAGEFGCLSALYVALGSSIRKHLPLHEACIGNIHGIYAYIYPI